MTEELIVRTVQQEDIESCGRILFEGFSNLADRHGFERDFPSAEVAASFAGALLEKPTVQGVLAEIDGRRIGCNFIDLASPVAAVGPLAVDPKTQNSGVGRTLMKAVMDRADTAGIANIRFAQAAYNNASMSLYPRLGFEARAQLCVLQGPAIDERLPGYDVAPASEDDVRGCAELCNAVHGFSRSGDLHAALRAGSAMAVLNHGRLSGYTTGIGFGGHTVAEDNQSLKALIAAAPEYPGLGFLLPTANHAVLRWCLSKGLRIVLQMNLMSMGLYSAPSGAWMPSVLR